MSYDIKFCHYFSSSGLAWEEEQPPCSSAAGQGPKAQKKQKIATAMCRFKANAKSKAGSAHPCTHPNLPHADTGDKAGQALDELGGCHAKSVGAIKWAKISPTTKFSI
jgi:hypothetical protein